MKRWPVVLMLLVTFAAIALAKNYSDFLGLPMSYLYNDGGYATNGTPISVFSTINSNGYVFVSGTNGVGTWVATNTFVSGFTGNVTPSNSTSVFFITNGLVKGFTF